MVTTIQELARRSVVLAGLYIMNACYGSLNIAEAGTEEQKRRLLPDLCAGKILFAYGLSEPDVGADLASVRTRAERRGDRVDDQRLQALVLGRRIRGLHLHAGPLRRGRGAL